MWEYFRIFQNIRIYSRLLGNISEHISMEITKFICNEINILKIIDKKLIKYKFHIKKFIFVVKRD